MPALPSRDSRRHLPLFAELYDVRFCRRRTIYPTGAADVVGAGAMGFVIMLMAITDTEHPPPAATTPGFSLPSLDRLLDWLQVGLFAGAVLLPAAAKALSRRQLQDLID